MKHKPDELSQQMHSYKLQQIILPDIGDTGLGDMRMLAGALADDVFAGNAVNGCSQMQITFVGLCQLRVFNGMTVNFKRALPFRLFESPGLEVGVQTGLNTAYPFVSSTAFGGEFAKADY